MLKCVAGGVNDLNHRYRDHQLFSISVSIKHVSVKLSADKSEPVISFYFQV